MIVEVIDENGGGSGALAKAAEENLGLPVGEEVRISPICGPKI